MYYVSNSIMHLLALYKIHNNVVYIVYSKYSQVSLVTILQVGAVKPCIHIRVQMFCRKSSGIIHFKWSFPSTKIVILFASKLIFVNVNAYLIMKSLNIFS